MAQLLLKPRPPEEDIDFDVILLELTSKIQTLRTNLNLQMKMTSKKCLLKDTLQQEKFWQKLLKKKK